MRGIVQPYCTQSLKQRRNYLAVSFLLFSVSFRRKIRQRRYPDIIETRIQPYNHDAFLITRYYFFLLWYLSLPLRRSKEGQCVKLYLISMRHGSLLSLIQNTRYASRSHHLVWREWNAQRPSHPPYGIRLISHLTVKIRMFFCSTKSAYYRALSHIK